MGVRGVAMPQSIPVRVSSSCYRNAMRDHGFFRLEIKRSRFYGASLKAIPANRVPAVWGCHVLCGKYCDTGIL